MIGRPGGPVRKLASIALLGLLPSCGGGNEAACDAFVADATACYDAYCDGDAGDTTFCGCWSQGMDVSLVDCSCIPRDLESACPFAGGDYQPGDLDCDGAQDALGNFCAG
jgi:hypothetical protein